MDFDYSLKLEDMRHQLGLGTRPLNIEKECFLRWVNNVLILNWAPIVDEIRIRFEVDSQDDVNRWIRIALEKKVKRLELDLTNYKADLDIHCNFPTHLLHSSSFSSLTTLRLAYVNVTGDFLEYLISHCPFLEVLCISNSSSLMGLNVCGPSLKLKYLEIHKCLNINILEISAEKLVSFTYVGEKIDIYFKKVPRLVEVEVGGRYGRLFFQKLDLLFPSYYLAKLEVLKLDPYTLNQPKFPQNFPQLRDLKCLELAVAAPLDLLPYTPLIRACPLLHKFTLKVSSLFCLCLI
ncbi:F-box/FBD/LRR-repeat protein At4g26340-like [Fagus crenata]